MLKIREGIFYYFYLYIYAVSHTQQEGCLNIVCFFNETISTFSIGKHNIG